MTQQDRLDPKTASELLTDHPYYRYRGCAPDPEQPGLAAGDPSLSVDAWQAPDVDGGEEPEERAVRVEAAKAVCRRCPVLEVCAVFGASVTADGRLAERHSILGGLTALERTKVLVEERQAREAVPVPAPVEQIRTEQKLAVLRALAAHEDAEGVAAAAGLDVRTAKWQLSRLTTQLGLGKSASRADVLAAAVDRGLLRPDEVADPRPAAPVPAEEPVSETAEPVRLVPRGRSRRRAGAMMPGQLALDELLGVAA
ncbi:WhiB family transcriptional regulator [Streptomyces sp. NPDC101117]|uniref:WhiB family transcriptional regulator n=1 Tax=Streptomyces sp. NPDC101117 TaxID=3366108 RepID=UPI0037F1DAB0